MRRKLLLVVVAAILLGSIAILNARLRHSSAQKQTSQGSADVWCGKLVQLRELNKELAAAAGKAGEVGGRKDLESAMNAAGEVLLSIVYTAPSFIRDDIARYQEIPDGTLQVSEQEERARIANTVNNYVRERCGPGIELL